MTDAEKRECTLDEWCERLYAGHLANKQLGELREEVARLTREREELRAELERLKPFFGQEGLAIVRKAEVAEGQRDAALALLRIWNRDEHPFEETESFLSRPDIAALRPAKDSG